jgi:hypothetical protein
MSTTILNIDIKIPKVENMSSPRSGDAVKNQYIIDIDNMQVFQSYSTVIAVKRYGQTPFIVLDSSSWDYSTTTGKYRNQFLNETKKETLAKINSGEYALADLNGRG